MREASQEAADSGDYQRQGALLKQRNTAVTLGSKESGYRVRFFMLSNGTFSYAYRSDDIGEPRGSIAIADLVVPRQSGHAAPDYLYPFIVKSEASAVQWRLASQSVDTAREWLRSLALAKRSATAPPSLPLPPSTAAAAVAGGGAGAAENGPSRGLPQELEQRLEEALARMEREAGSPPGAEWTRLSESQGVQRHVRKSGQGRVAARGDATMPYSPAEIFFYLADSQVLLALDDMLESSRCFAVQDDHTWFDHLVYKSLWPVAAREYVNVSRWRRTGPNGNTLVAASVSLNHSAAALDAPKCPQGAVRADLFVGGWCLRPRPQGGGCDATYLVDLDLKGSLPSWLVAKATSQQACMPGIVTSILPEFLQSASAPKELSGLASAIHSHRLAYAERRSRPRGAPAASSGGEEERKGVAQAPDVHAPSPSPAGSKDEPLAPPPRRSRLMLLAPGVVAVVVAFLAGWILSGDSRTPRTTTTGTFMHWSTLLSFIATALGLFSTYQFHELSSQGRRLEEKLDQLSKESRAFQLASATSQFQSAATEGARSGERRSII